MVLSDAIGADRQAAAVRSFRQAALIDPEAPMAYWGMAMANLNNEKRAKEFIKEAVALGSGISILPARTMQAIRTRKLQTSPSL
jgi:hypothetical protein